MFTAALCGFDSESGTEETTQWEGVGDAQGKRDGS